MERFRHPRDEGANVVPGGEGLGSVSGTRRDQDLFWFPFMLYGAMLLPQNAFPACPRSGNPVIIFGAGQIIHGLRGIFTTSISCWTDVKFSKKREPPQEWARNAIATIGTMKVHGLRLQKSSAATENSALINDFGSNSSYARDPAVFSFLSKYIRSAPSFISNDGIPPCPQIMSSTIDTVLIQLVVRVRSENYEHYL